MAGRARDLPLDTLAVEQEDRVLTVKVYDPPYKYMTAQMQKDLDELTAAVDDDATVGAVILTGGVPGRFITHFDIAEILAAARHSGRPHAHRGLSGLLDITRFNEVVLRIMRSPAVYIAAIGGPCGGGGLEMSVCFDVRLAADNESTVFVLPELLIGLTTTVGGQRLAQLVGPARTLEMMLEGRTYTPAEAMQMGLVNRVVPTESLVEEAKALAARYARPDRGTIAAQKRIFIENLVMSPAESLRNEGTPAQRPSSPARL